MWSDNDIDDAFRRLDPAEPDPTPFPLDAWLKLESGLDQAVIDRAVRRRLWQFFAAEVAVVALVGLGWSLWPAGDVPASAVSKAPTEASPALPMGKAADVQRLRNLGSSGATAAAARPGTGSLTSAMSRPVATPAAAAPATTLATTVAAISAVSPGPEAAGRARPLPLAAALIAGRHSAPTTRSYSANSPLANSDNGAAELAGPAGRHSENAAVAWPTTRKFATHPLTATAAGAKASRSTYPPTENGGSPASFGPAAGHPMAVPSRAASEGTVADAASHGLSASEATSATRRPVVAGEPSAATGAAATEEALAAHETAATRLNEAAGSLAPLAAAVALPNRPATEPVPAILALVAFEPNPLPAVVRQPRFFVGVVAAPDVSTVKFVDVQAPHLNVGLTLEYRLGQRWRLATGVQRAMKEYYARREDYDWTEYPRAQTRDFSWVEGQCTVIDVPLNLRYDAVVQGHARWFGTAGLSSFFMHRENYNYDYLESGTYKNWELPGLVNANQHFFSVLNLSAGYEYGLGTHWRLQAEPYVKVPLAGVGAGKVKLLSAGVYFGLKYGF